jgi:hypothetical protein
LGAIFPSLAAPTPAATAMTSELVPVGTRSGSLRFPIHPRLLQAGLERSHPAADASREVVERWLLDVLM